MSVLASRCLVVAVAIGSLGIWPTGAEEPVFQFETAYDASAGKSSAFIYGTLSRKDIAAVTGWLGKLPANYPADGRGSFVPTRLLGELRDQLKDSDAPEAKAALDWILDRMGFYSGAPVSQIPEAVLSPILGIETSKWCGVSTKLDGRCPSDCTPTDNPGTCSGCGCSGSKTWPD